MNETGFSVAHLQPEYFAIASDATVYAAAILVFCLLVTGERVMSECKSGEGL